MEVTPRRCVMILYLYLKPRLRNRGSLSPLLIRPHGVVLKQKENVTSLSSTLSI